MKWAAAAQHRVKYKYRPRINEAVINSASSIATSPDDRPNIRDTPSPSSSSYHHHHHHRHPGSRKTWSPSCPGLIDTSIKVTAAQWVANFVRSVMSPRQASLMDGWLNAGFKCGRRLNVFGSNVCSRGVSE